MGSTVRRRRDNPSSRDVAGFAIGLLGPFALVAAARAWEGRELVSGIKPGASLQLGPVLDPSMASVFAAALTIGAGLGVARSGWSPGLDRGAVVGGPVALALAMFWRARARAAALAGPAAPPQVGA